MKRAAAILAAVLLGFGLLAGTPSAASAAVAAAAASSIAVLM